MRVHELYDTVTNRIIAELEAGAVPWVKPWKNGPVTTGILPHNGATHRPYNGINVMLLWAEREVKGYSTPNWMTYRQAVALGAQVKGGEKATTVVFTKQLRFKDKETEEETKVGMLRTYAVFNADQIDGLPAPASPTNEAKLDPGIDAVESFITATGATIRMGGNKACYVPSHDFIAMPEKHQFKSLEHYYAQHYTNVRTGAAMRSGSTATSRTVLVPRPMPPRSWWRNCRLPSYALTLEYQES